MTQEIKMGDPVILEDAKGLQKYGLFKGCKGTANSLQVVVGDGDYLLFMPKGNFKMYWIQASRFVLDEEG